MSDRLEDRIRRGAEHMYQTSTPVEDLIPSDLADRAGKPSPEPAIIRLGPPARRSPRRGWLMGLAAAAAILLMSVPVLFLLDETDQEPAATKEILVSRSVTALFEGESGGFHYQIAVFAGPGEEGQPPPTNAAVEVKVFSNSDDNDPIFECFANEKTLDATSLIDINQSLATASFQGEYRNSPCYFGNVTFDLDWTGRGSLVNEPSPSDAAGEICRDRYAALADGTVQFSSGPITDPITVASNEATIVIAEETRCLTSGTP